jgi:hypothetical protein
MGNHRVADTDLGEPSRLPTIPDRGDRAQQGASVGRREYPLHEQSQTPTTLCQFPSYVPQQVQSIMRKFGWNGGGLGREENGIRSVGELLERSTTRDRPRGLGYQECIDDLHVAETTRKRATGIHWVQPSTIATSSPSRFFRIDYTQPRPVACDNYSISSFELLCVLPALASFKHTTHDASSGMRIREPFRPAAAVSYAWASLGHRCDSTPCHELGPVTDLGPGVLATFPTTAAREALLASECLQHRPEWAVLVPTDYTESPSFSGVDRDELVFIHIRRRLAVTWDTHSRTLFLSWVVRGARFIHNELCTDRGFEFFTADASQTLYPSELAVEQDSNVDTTGCQRGSISELQTQACQARVYGMRPHRAPLDFAAAADDSVTPEELDSRIVCLQSMSRRLKENGDSTTQPMLKSIVDEWAKAFQADQPTTYPVKLLRATMRLVKQGVSRMGQIQSESAVKSLAAAMSNTMLPDTMVRDALHVASALTPISGGTAVCVQMAVTAMLSADEKSKKAFKAAKHCLATCLCHRPRETLVNILGCLEAHVGGFSEKARYYLASVLRKQSAAAVLADLAAYPVVLAMLEPTSGSPTGNLVWDTGHLSSQPAVDNHVEYRRSECQSDGGVGHNENTLTGSGCVLRDETTYWRNRRQH